MKYLKSLHVVIFLLISCFVLGQSPFGEEPLAHTYSIVAYDREAGQMGVAVQSHWFSVGSVVSWGEGGVGVVATQSFVNPAYGPKGLELLKLGFSAQEALNILVQQDEGRAFRQVSLLDANGNVATHTGASCIENASHITGEGFSVQANMMDNDDVCPRMAEAFQNLSGLPLAERLVAAMDSAEQAGGDIRGKQSAAILVFKIDGSGRVWEDKLIDLRVDDHPEPIAEIKRLLKVHRAYEHMNRGDLAVERGDSEGALREYSAAQSMFPENLEMKYWHAVALVNMGRLDEALPMFQEVFTKDTNWRRLTMRLTKNEILKVNRSDLRTILDL
jgi:uncharacterized Ntn-hydrolase superfamily protein